MHSSNVQLLRSIDAFPEPKDSSRRPYFRQPSARGQIGNQQSASERPDIHAGEALRA
jgi:hypothetical protein